MINVVLGDDFLPVDGVHILFFGRLKRIAVSSGTRYDLDRFGLAFFG